MRLIEDVKDIVFDYDHQLRFSPTLRLIEHTYKCSKAFAEARSQGYRDLGLAHEIVEELYQQELYAMHDPEWFR